jgi:hypothetical protein
MLFPSIVCVPRDTRTCAWKPDARWTKRAAARACSPSRFATVTDRDVTGYLDLRLRVQQIRRHPDRVASNLTHLPGNPEQVG